MMGNGKGTHMHLYVVRHGIAEEQSRSGRDADRALTEEGKQKMKEAARGLKKMEIATDRIFASPLVRARQTAEIMGSELKTRVEEMKELAPGHAPQEVCGALKKSTHGGAVMVVGHEPNCSELVSHLLDAPSAVSVDFKKGAVCLVETETLEMGSGVLIWHFPPKALRLMGVED